MPGKRNFSSYSQEQNTSMGRSSTTNINPSNKKLRRLPHVFSKVLELPFKFDDQDVYVEERNDCLEFIASTTNNEVIEVGILVVEVLPGISKVVVRTRGSQSQPSIVDDIELDTWRFRLPATARPELATVVYAAGQLVVTVPKNGIKGD